MLQEQVAAITDAADQCYLSYQNAEQNSNNDKLKIPSCIQEKTI